MDDWAGIRFCPMEDEMVGCHLHCKLTGRILRVNELISEINIYNFDPWELRLKSKVKLRDSVWYFFTPVENNGDRQSRTTNSGFWKITGNPLPIYDRWGLWSGNRGKIGFKRVLRFHKGRIANVGKADWVMHEYHNTMLPPNLRTHVMCRVEYKGDDTRFLSDNPTEISPAFVHHLMNSTTSMVNLPVQGNWGGSIYVSADEKKHLNTQEQGPSLVSNGDEIQMGLESLLGEEFMVCTEYEKQPLNKQEQVLSLGSNDKEMQMLFNSCIEDFDSMLNELNMQENWHDSESESMVLGNSSSFAESRFYLNELCFDSPPNSPEFTYEASPYEEEE